MQGQPGLSRAGLLPGGHLQDRPGGADRHHREAFPEWSGLQVSRNYSKCVRYSSKKNQIHKKFLKKVFLGLKDFKKS